MTTELLTPAEHALVGKIGSCWNDLCRIVGHGPSREADLLELVAHVHALQQAVLSNAAARAFPGTYRALGETLDTGPWADLIRAVDGTDPHSAPADGYDTRSLGSVPAPETLEAGSDA